MTILIVGESNPYGADPKFALYHLPRNASGNRLREHLGLGDWEYAKIAKVNLCYQRWNMREARERAQGVLAGGYSVVILLGAKVRAAFTGPPPFTSTPTRVRSLGWQSGPILVGLPHPSGLNRQWSKPDARKRAVELLTRVAPEIPWRCKP